MRDIDDEIAMLDNVRTKLIETRAKCETAVAVGDRKTVEQCYCEIARYETEYNSLIENAPCTLRIKP